MHSLLKRLEPSFQFSVRPRIKRRNGYVGHPEDADELLEIPGDELGPLSEMIMGFASGISPWLNGRTLSSFPAEAG
jgi:hypothetical protein